MNAFRVSAVVLLASTVAGGAQAQILERPERPIRGLFGGTRTTDPDQTRQTLTLNLDSLGGYDDNLTPVETSGIDSLTSRPSGYTGFAAAGLRYGRDSKASTLEIRGRGYLNSFRNVGITPSFGADLQAHLTTSLDQRKRHQLQLGGAARSDPFYSPGTLGPLRADFAPGALPGENPANGFYTRRSLSSDASMSLTSRWSTHNTVTAGYRYVMRDFQDDLGDSSDHSASVEYVRSLGRRTGLRTGYRHSRSTLVDQLEQRRFDQDIVEAGLQHEQRLTRTRRLILGFGVGASSVDTTDARSRAPIDYILPSGYGRALIDLGRTWNVAGEYRRALSMLEGLTLQPFVTDAAMARLGGLVARRAEIAFWTAYSNGASAPGTVGTFDSYTAAAQLRYWITPSWSAVVGHSFYAYRTHGIADLPRGFADTLNRNALRVGMTFDLPLYGSAATPNPPAAGRD
jgi:hypothetical protein